MEKGIKYYEEKIEGMEKSIKTTQQQINEYMVKVEKLKEESERCPYKTECELPAGARCSATINAYIQCNKYKIQKAIEELEDMKRRVLMASPINQQGIAEGLLEIINILKGDQ